MSINGSKGKEKSKDALLALLLNAAVLAVLLLVFQPFFETNDDTALMTLVNGAKYSADPHMVISGIWMGRLLMALYGLTHGLPWYTLVQYAMLFLSFTGVTYVLLRRLGRPWGIVLSLLLAGWFGYSSYIVIQFSRTAGIAAASAMFLLFHAVSGRFSELSDTQGSDNEETQEDMRRKAAGGSTGEYRACVVSALVLAVLSSWLRFTQFLPCAALTSGIGLWMLLTLIPEHIRRSKERGRAGNPVKSPVRSGTGAGRPGPGERSGRHGRPAGQAEHASPGLIRKLVFLLLPFAAALCLSLIFRFDDKRSYRQSDVWEDFRQFDLRREELYDYGFPDYPTNVETYRSVGISDAGYTLYRNWNFADPERFTVEAMDALIAVKEERHFGRQMVKDFLKEVPRKLLLKPYIWFLFFSLIAFFASGIRKAAGAAAPMRPEGKDAAPMRQEGEDAASMCGGEKDAAPMRIREEDAVSMRTGEGEAAAKPLHEKEQTGRRDHLKKLAAVAWGLLLFCALYLYLFYQGRYLRNRVDTALVYALILSILWFVRPAGVKRTWWIVPVLVVCMVSVPGMKQNFRLRSSGAKRLAKMEKRRGLLEELSADQEHLYVMKMGSLVANDCYGPLDVMPERVIGNLLYLGGWAAYTKAFMDTMEAYGIANPYRDLINSDRLFLVDNDIELTMTYLRENYAPDAGYEQVGELQKFGIYRVYAG